MFLRYNELLDIDDTDKKIIELLEHNPEMTHSAISEKVNKSQPAVGARIIKLKRKFLLSEIIGAEFDKLDIKLARIDLSVKNVEALWNRFKKCPYIVNCFKLTGKFNMLIEILAPNVTTIEIFIDSCLRKDAGITDIHVNYIIDSLRKYVVPLSFEIEKYQDQGCGQFCGSGPLTSKDLELLLSEN